MPYHPERRALFQRVVEDGLSGPIEGALARHFKVAVSRSLPEGHASLAVGLVGLGVELCIDPHKLLTAALVGLGAKTVAEATVKLAENVNSTPKAEVSLQAHYVALLR